MNTLLMLLLLANSASAEGVVEAAKSAKEKRKTSTTKVITNKDVRSSKGKVIEKAEAVKPADSTLAPNLVEQHAAQQRKRLELETKIATSKALIAERTKVVAAIEQSYYEEHDLDRRDRVIALRFVEAKAALDEAIAEMTAAENELNPPAPRDE